MANEYAEAIAGQMNNSGKTMGNINLAKITFDASGYIYPDYGTATATHPTTVTGAATISKMSGIVTTDVDCNSAAGATYTLTLTNTLITTSCQIYVSVCFGTATTGEPVVMTVTPGSGSAVIVIKNAAAAAAFNGSLKISFFALIPT